LPHDDVIDTLVMAHNRVWEHIAQVRNLRRHPYEFYQRQSYTIGGVIPDANGQGKPDIFMAKSLMR
jgi:aminoglycoside 6'-N-acetyltransferase I